MDYGAIIQVAFSLIGEAIKGGKEQQAEAILKNLRREVGNIPLPSLDEIKAEVLGPSAMEGVSTDPTLEASQYEALGALGEVGDTGMSAVDTAALNRIANQTARRQRAGMAGIEADMAARGLAGSGVDYGVRAAMASDANQRLSEEGQNIGAQSLERRLKALMGKGELAGKVRGQSWDEKSEKAKAADAINKANAQMRERAQYYNANLPQQRFHNALAKVGAKANPSNTLAGFYQGQGNSQGQLWAGLGAAANNAVGSSTGEKTSTYDGYGAEELSDEENKRRGRKLYEDDDK